MVLTIAGHTAKDFGGTPIKGVVLADPNAQPVSLTTLRRLLDSGVIRTSTPTRTSTGQVSVRVAKITTPDQPRGASITSLAPDTGQSLVSIFGNIGESAGTIARQQALSNKYGIPTFDVLGDLSTISSVGPTRNVEGSGKFKGADFSAVLDTINAALFPSAAPPQTPQPDVGGGSSSGLFDSLKAGLTDLGSQLNKFIGSFTIPDPNAGTGAQGSLPADAAQQAAQNGGGLLGGGASIDPATGLSTADTSTQPKTSFFDQLKKNPTELVIVIAAIILFIALIARHR